eukprot:SAG22_NODE_1615_length_3986_cov_3.960895_2_plen_74_part_00
MSELYAMEFEDIVRHPPNPTDAATESVVDLLNDLLHLHFLIRTLKVLLLNLQMLVPLKLPDRYKCERSSENSI